MDWKSLRERAGLTLEQLADKSGYGISTINGLELRNEGSARLRKRLAEILNVESKSAERGKIRNDDLEDGPAGTMEEWRLRAIKAEEENVRLKAAVRDLVSSTPLSADADLAARLAPVALRDSLASGRSQRAAAPSGDKPSPGDGVGKDSK